MKPFVVLQSLYSSKQSKNGGSFSADASIVVGAIITEIVTIKILERSFNNTFSNPMQHSFASTSTFHKLRYEDCSDSFYCVRDDSYTNLHGI